MVTASGSTVNILHVLRGAMVVLTIATALIHFTLLFPNPAFILSGLGYLTLLALQFVRHPVLEGRERTVRWALLAYTVLIMVLWVAFGSRIRIAYIDKVIELILVADLIWQDRIDR